MTVPEVKEPDAPGTPERVQRRSHSNPALTPLWPWVATRILTMEDNPIPFDRQPSAAARAGSARVRD